MSALIPFGIDKETRSIREVGDVPRGRKCGCICPSCKAGLVARKGSENEWHFAHDHRAEARPKKKCDISFESACRLFVIDLLKSGQIPMIATPAVGNSLAAGNGRYRPATQLEGLEFVDSQEYGDVKAEIKGYTLEVFIDYSSRVRPDAPGNPESTGVLAFPVDQVRNRYMAVRGGPRVLAGIVKDIFADVGTWKRWLHHPFIQKATPPSEMSKNRGSAAGILTDEQVTRITWGLGGQARSGRPPSFGSATQVVPIRREPRRADQKGAYKCYRCDHTWQGGESSGRVCPQCGSNRHSVFSPY